MCNVAVKGKNCTSLWYNFVSNCRMFKSLSQLWSWTGSQVTVSVLQAVGACALKLVGGVNRQAILFNYARTFNCYRSNHFSKIIDKNIWFKERKWIGVGGVATGKTNI